VAKHLSEKKRRSWLRSTFSKLYTSNFIDTGTKLNKVGGHQDIPAIRKKRAFKQKESEEKSRRKHTRSEAQ